MYNKDDWDKVFFTNKKLLKREIRKRDDGWEKNLKSLCKYSKINKCISTIKGVKISLKLFTQNMD